MTIFASRKDHPLLDPVSIFLFIVALLLTLAQIQARLRPAAPASQAGMEARVAEMRWALGGLSGNKTEFSPKAQKNKWDAAVEIVLLSEQGQTEKAQAHLHLAPDGAFRVCWEAAYNDGLRPSGDEIAIAMNGLGGLSGKYLEASLLEASMMSGSAADGGIMADDGRAKTAPEEMRQKALAQCLTRAALLGVLVAAMIAGALAGIAVAIWMLAKPKPMPDAPQFQMPVAYIVRVCLGWYIALLTSGTIIAFIDGAVPLGDWRFPAVYAFHAILGIAFICAAEKISFAALWKKISQAGWSWTYKGVKFLSVALGGVLILALAISFFMPPSDPPQKELVELIRTTKGIVPFILIFGTIALLGPAFEEIFFRGFLLSALRRRLSIFWAVALSSLLFGAIHFQLTGLPVLATLGAALGLAFVATRDIKAAIFVHACWNGGVFLLQRLLMG